MNKNLNGWSFPKKMPRWGWIVLVLTLLGAAAYLRIATVQGTDVISPIRADARQYYNYAHNLKEHGVYSIQDFERTGRPAPDAQRNPGYPLFLLPFVESPPTFDMIDRIMWAQVLLSLLTLILALVLFRSFLVWHWALLAGLFVALSPHLVVANVYVLTETLFTMLLTGFLAALGWFGRRPRWRNALLAGVVLGAALLVRPTLLYFPAILLPALFLILHWRRALSLGIVLTFGFLLVYGPWIVRNQALPAAAQSSKALDSIHKGMYPDLMYQSDPTTYGFPNRVDPAWDERGESLEKVIVEIQERFTNEPTRYLRWYLIGKPVTFLSWGMVVGMGDVFIYPVSESPYLQLGVIDLTHRLMRGLHWPITLLALVGCILVWLPAARDWFPMSGLLAARVAALTVGYFLLIHIAGTPLPRYAIPLRPLIYGLGVLGGVMGYRVLNHKFRRPIKGQRHETHNSDTLL